MAERIPVEVLRDMPLDQLKEQLESCRLEHQKLLQQRHSHTVEPDEIRTARKNVTRCVCVIREMELQSLVEEYKGKRFLPKQLRPKLNKALRMKLTDRQKNARVRRLRVHQAKYPMKVFSFNN